MFDSTAEVSLKRWDQQCADYARRSGCNQEETKIAEQTTLKMLGDIKLYALSYEWPLKGVRRSGDKGDDSEQRERHSNTSRADASDPYRVGQRRDNVDYECKSADDEKLGVHAIATRLRKRPSVPGRRCRFDCHQTDDRTERPELAELGNPAGRRRRPGALERAEQIVVRIR
ncbi:protein of unknown function [Paraburkholderia kururiensis]